MRSDLSPTLRGILADTSREIAADQARESLEQLKARQRDALPILPFATALASGNALIGEIKERSPSQGKMRPENVRAAPQAYKTSSIVRAVSVLTSWNHFGEGMTVKFMEAIKRQVRKPILRKDFIIDEYQVYQARAYGADAILIMANVLEADEMRRLSDLAFELGMDVLFETHRPDELPTLPPKARIIGINSRNFQAGFSFARFLRRWLRLKRDRSVNIGRFEYVARLPAQAIKVAESGISAANCREVFASGFHSLLVGTSLLMDPRGIRAALGEFETALQALAPGGPRTVQPANSLVT